MVKQFNAKNESRINIETVDLVNNKVRNNNAYPFLSYQIEMFVSDYIDLHNTAVTQRAAAAFAKVPTATDISSFFLRKEVNRSKKVSCIAFCDL